MYQERSLLSEELAGLWGFAPEALRDRYSDLDVQALIAEQEYSDYWAPLESRRDRLTLRILGIKDAGILSEEQMAALLGITVLEVRNPSLLITRDQHLEADRLKEMAADKRRIADDLKRQIEREIEPRAIRLNRQMSEIDAEITRLSGQLSPFVEARRSLFNKWYSESFEIFEDTTLF